MADVLFICTGNLCRSPSAEWFLAQRLAEFGPAGVTVESAGTSGTTLGVPPELAQEGAAFGMDLSAHVPRRMDASIITRADMVIGMTREHVRQVVLADPTSFTKSFTLREIVQRGKVNGHRRRHELLPEWLAHIGAGRRHVDLIGDSRTEDIPDPMGGNAEGFRRMLTELATLTRMLHSLTWPSTQG